MNKEELKTYLDSTKEKLKLLREKAFKEEKEKYPIIVMELETYEGDIEFIEDNLDHDLDENTLETFKILLDQINETADLDLKQFINETGLDTPLGQAFIAMKRAALDNEKTLTEEKNVEIPPVENITAQAEATEVPAKEVNELDQVNTEEIINSLEDTPNVEPVPQDLVNDMIAASEASEVEEKVEAPVVEEQPIQTVPTQDVDLNAIDNILNTLEEPTNENVAPVIEEQPVAVEAPVAPEVAAEPVQAPVEQPVAVEAPVAPEVVAEPVQAPVEQPVAVEAPVAPEVIAEPVQAPIEQPVAVEAPVVPEMVAPTTDAFAQQPVAAPAPQVEGPVLAKTL